MLEVRGLKAAYDGKEALHGLDFDVESGGCVCVVGPNGAGKTTLMKCIAGTLASDAGSIVLDGEAITRRKAFERVAKGIALVPEGRRVFAPLTVLENLQLGAFRRLWPRPQSGVNETLEFVFSLFPRLQERHRQLAGSLSGGEQQMLAIGRALMSRPRLLLLDEPSMGLAPLVVKEIFATLKRLNGDGLSILLAEQNAHMALHVATYAYVISGGIIVKHGDAATMARDPGIAEAYFET